MEKLLFKPYDKEHMRMAMLRHEATFKEQVYELHRLYQIQKILMKNTCSQRKRDSDQRPITAVDYDIGDGSDGGDNVALEVVIDERDIELTLGPTRYSQVSGRRRRSQGITKLEGAINSDRSSSSTGSSSQMDRMARAPETASFERQTASNNNVGNVDEELRLKHPPWPFQVLSLNMT